MMFYLPELRKKVVLQIIKVGRGLFKNTRFESSFLVNYLYKILFSVGFSGMSPEVEVIFHGLQFSTSSKDKSMLPGLMNQTYELNEIKFFKSVLRPGWVVLDIGANIGLYSKIASEIVKANGHVYCFEPTPVTRTFLGKNLATCSNTTIVPMAVGSKSGRINLYLESENFGCNSLLAKTDNTIEVQMISIDDFVAANPQIQKIDFIKIDIEGFEEEALAGMINSLKLKPILMIELNPTFLRQHGRRPEEFLISLHQRFGKVSYVCEKTGALKPLPQIKDLGHQLIANVVLENPLSS